MLSNILCTLNSKVVSFFFDFSSNSHVLHPYSNMKITSDLYSLNFSSKSMYLLL